MTFYDKKIKTFFSRFDTNKNGTVELDDFNQWSTRLAKERGLDAQKSSNLAKNMAEIWRFFFYLLILITIAKLKYLKWLSTCKM
jgi:hypothetical protein